MCRGVLCCACVRLSGVCKPKLAEHPHMGPLWDAVFGPVLVCGCLARVSGVFTAARLLLHTFFALCGLAKLTHDKVAQSDTKTPLSHGSAA